MNGLVKHWNRIWFTPGPALDLAIARAIICGYVFYLDFGLTGKAVANPFFWDLWRPVSVFILLENHVPTPQMLTLLATVWKVALAFACVGLFSRSSLAVCFVLGLYVLGWGQNFGKVDHSHHVALLIMGIFALSRCGDAFSVDAWRRRRHGVAPPGKSSEYTWPLRCGGLVMMMMFFAGGVAKLRKSGLEWIFSDNLSNMIILKHYDKLQLHDLGLYLAEIGWLCQVVAFVTIAAELLGPLALLGRWPRALLIPLLFGMQVGIGLAMGVHKYSPNFACYSIFVPWEALRLWLLARRR